MASPDETIRSLAAFSNANPEGFGAILIDPPWRFMNRTGKVAPEHKRLARYETMATTDLAALPVGTLARPQSHLYLWCPNALLADGLRLVILAAPLAEP
ncbi:MAG: MT-A70 family methyltransferase, partial [Kiloniellaceae bacterium]